MNLPRRLIALGLAGALALAACGNDDPVAAPADEPAAETGDGAADPSTSNPSALPSSGPDATIPADVPEEFLPAIGPVEVSTFETGSTAVFGWHRHHRRFGDFIGLANVGAG